MAPGAKYNNAETANLDLVSEIKDGQVIFSINSQVQIWLVHNLTLYMIRTF